MSLPPPEFDSWSFNAVWYSNNTKNKKVIIKKSFGQVKWPDKYKNILQHMKTARLLLYVQSMSFLQHILWSLEAENVDVNWTACLHKLHEVAAFVVPCNLRCTASTALDSLPHSYSSHHWAASYKKVPINGLSRCHTKRIKGSRGCAHSSFVMTPTFYLGRSEKFRNSFSIFEHTCAYARWALIPRFASVCPSVCPWLDQNSDWTICH